MALTAGFLLQEEEHVEQQDQYQVEHPPPGHGHHLLGELEDGEAGATRSAGLDGAPTTRTRQDNRLPL